ncbi:MAG: hypothetical protein D8M58_04215 [Calditrichaeota bacterium]|nr:MAG: hypothetical protein DWQ03_02860 [Calditrichota bacterium]MBL1204574.1 hypothetical protein [Calditrichota bacterium]NOG44403.1 hypothetical protein [Calditrichota bacterium]
MPNFVYYIPVATTLFSIYFAWHIFRRYNTKGGGMHLLWWGAGVVMYGVGTFTESYVSIFGWNEFIFRSWYIAGALLGGAPLAQGTVYLLLKPKTANRLTWALIPAIIIAAFFVLITPLDYSQVEPFRLSGGVIHWQWVRLFSPFINLYAFVFLVGGAILSAVRFKRNNKTYYRFIGNVLIAFGALLPGIGGTFTRFGYIEILYITEFLGLSLIFAGYLFNINNKKLIDLRDKKIILS